MNVKPEIKAELKALEERAEKVETEALLPGENEPYAACALAANASRT